MIIVSVPQVVLRKNTTMPRFIFPTIAESIPLNLGGNLLIQTGVLPRVPQHNSDTRPVGFRWGKSGSTPPICQTFDTKFGDIKEVLEQLLS